MKNSWPTPEEVRSWQRSIRALLKRKTISQSDAARRCHVSLKTIEAWLAPPESTWARTPTFVEKYGVQTILNIVHGGTDRVNSARRKKASDASELVASRKKEWPRKTMLEIATEQSITTAAVWHYCKRHEITPKKSESKRGRKSK